MVDPEFDPKAEPSHRPTITMLPYLLGAVGVIVIMFGLFVMENYFGIGGRGRALREGDSPLSIWFPVASIPLAIAGAFFFYWRHAQIIRGGVSVLAKVTAIGSIEKAGMRDLSFQYECSGSTRNKKKSLTSSEVSKLSIGDRFPILVLPNDIDRYFIVSTDAVADD